VVPRVVRHRAALTYQHDHGSTLPGIGLHICDNSPG
jgi:hypothetical protein